jgi:general nucleoside transport system permease protein
MSAAAELLDTERPYRVAALGGVVLGVLAILCTVPPITLETRVVPAILALAAIGLGLLAIARGERFLGTYAIGTGILGAGLAFVIENAHRSTIVAIVTAGLFAGTLQYATPLTFGALGGLLSERAGVVNIGLEGMMLTGAFFGIMSADKTGSWELGLVGAAFFAALLALVHAIFAIHLRADQIVSGTALNFVALGLTGYMYVDTYGANGTPDDLPAAPDITLPTDSLGFLGQAVSQLNILVWGSLLAVVLVWVVVFRTRLGLRLRSVGENPKAAETVGISVFKVRYAAVIASGGLAALGGVFLSIGFVHSFSQNMTAGRGFIALAALIFGRWRPGGLLAATLLFGFSSALAQRLPEFSPQLATLFQALPYVLTLIAVAGVVGRSTPPAADGVPYTREGK